VSSTTREAGCQKLSMHEIYVVHRRQDEQPS